MRTVAPPASAAPSAPPAPSRTSASASAPPSLLVRPRLERRAAAAAGLGASHAWKTMHGNSVTCPTSLVNVIVSPSRRSAW